MKRLLLTTDGDGKGKKFWKETTTPANIAEVITICRCIISIICGIRMESLQTPGTILTRN